MPLLSFDWPGTPAPSPVGLPYPEPGSDFQAQADSQSLGLTFADLFRRMQEQAQQAYQQAQAAPPAPAPPAPPAPVVPMQPIGEEIAPGYEYDAISGSFNPPAPPPAVPPPVSGQSLDFSQMRNPLATNAFTTMGNVPIEEQAFAPGPAYPEGVPRDALDLANMMREGQYGPAYTALDPAELKQIAQRRLDVGVMPPNLNTQRSALDPVLEGLVTAPFGGASIAANLLGRGTMRTAPYLAGSLGAEVGARGASQLAEEAGAPPAVQVGAGLLGGIAGFGGTASAPGALRAAGRGVSEGIERSTGQALASELGAAGKRAKPRIVPQEALQPPATAVDAFPPRPPVEPPTGTGGMVPPRRPPPPDPSAALDGVIPGERVPDAILRQYEGATSTAGKQLAAELDVGYRNLKAAGKANVVSVPGAHDPDIEELFKALHNEGAVPPKLQGVYDDVKRLLADEEAATLGFDPKFQLHPDYFPRFWEAPKPTRPGTAKMGTTPGFKKPRADATFTELLAAGYKPKTWNPYDMVAMRKIAGVEYREQGKVIAKLRETGQAVPVEGPIPDGWRIPRIGPAFEGKPYATKAGQVRYTKPTMVPDKVAAVLESTYGTPVEWGMLGPVDIHNFAMKAGNIPKRVKLFGSVFQQADFAARTGFATFGGAVDDLLSGKPLSAVMKTVQMPATIGKMAYANTSPARRRMLRAQLLSAEPVMKERPGLSWRMVSEQGLSTTDISVIERGIRDTLNKVARDPASTPPGVAWAVIRQRAGQLNNAIANGLFEGVYPQAQIEAIRNFVGPSLARAHPEWTDAQLAASIAVETNKMFSTLGKSQSVLRHSRNLQDFARTLIFSTNEPEALIKQALGTVAGPNKAMWAKFYLGGALFLGAVANGIHFATTGEPLPFDRYQPVKRDKYAMFGAGYNSNFLSPDVPIKGRSGANLRLDTVMQMDTVLRLLDPASFVRARENVITRAGETLYTGKDFFGRPIKGRQDMAIQLGSDLGLPIPAQQLLGALRGYSPTLENLVPENEGRLGTTGQLVQTSGMNLRAETNRELLDRVAREANLTMRDGNPVRRWEDLEPHQRKAIQESEQFQKAMTELDKRSQTAIERGSESAEGFAAREAIDTERLADEQKAVQLLNSGVRTPSAVNAFRDQVADIQAVAAIKKSQIDADYQLFKDSGKRPDDQNKAALFDYYEAYEQTKLPGQNIDYGALDKRLAELRGGWSEEQRAYVEANTRLTSHDPGVQEYYDAKTRLQPFFDARDKAWTATKSVAEQAPSGDPLKVILRYETWDDFGRAIESTLVQAGAKGTAIESGITKVEDSLKLNKILQAVKAAMIVQNPALEADLEAWYPHLAAKYIRQAAQAGEAIGAR